MEIHEHLLLKGTIGKMKAKLSHLQNETYDQMIEKHFEYALWKLRDMLPLKEKNHQLLERKLNILYLKNFIFLIYISLFNILFSRVFRWVQWI